MGTGTGYRNLARVSGSVPETHSGETAAASSGQGAVPAGHASAQALPVHNAGAASPLLSLTLRTYQRPKLNNDEVRKMKGSHFKILVWAIH